MSLTSVRVCDACGKREDVTAAELYPRGWPLLKLAFGADQIVVISDVCGVNCAAAVIERALLRRWGLEVPDADPAT